VFGYWYQILRVKAYILVTFP